MSKIGEYIHRHKENYLNYGINRTGVPGSISASQSFSKMRKLLYSKVPRTSASPQTLQQVGRFLTSLYFNKGQDIGFSKKKWEEFLKLWDKALKEKTNNIATVKYSENTGAVYAPPNKGNTYTDKSKISMKNLNKTIEKIKELNGNNVYQNIDTVPKVLKELERMKKEASSKGDTSMVSFSKSTNGDTFIKDLNYLVSFFSFPYKNIYGDLAETFLATVNVTLNSVKNKSLQKILKTIVGGAMSTTKIDMSNFAEGIDPKAIFNTTKSGQISGDEKNGVSYEIRATQTKADIIFTYKNTPLNISSKYMGVKSDNVKILSGASLLSLLSDEPGDAITHWLNLTSGTKDLSGLEQQRKDAISTIKLAILIKGLTGNYGGRSGVADVMQIVDRQAKQIKVFNIFTLINKIKSNLSLLDSAFDPGCSLDGFEMLENSTDPMGHVTHILAQVHNRKIAASLTKGFIKTLN